MGIRSISGLALAAVLLVPSLAGAQTLDERARIASRARRVEDRLRALEREAEGLVREENSLLVELRRLQIARDVKDQELLLLQIQLEEARRNLEATNAKIAALEQAVRRRRPVLAAQLVQLYKLGQPGYARLVLSLEDLRAAGRGYREVTALALSDRRRVEEQTRDLAALKAARVTLERGAHDVERLRAATNDARRALDRAAADKRRLIASIESRRDLTVKLTAELQNSQRQLQGVLSDLGAGRPVGRVDVPLRAFRRDLDWPAPGPLAAPFGRQRNRRFGTVILRHGIEIGAATGTPVRAVHEGTIVYAEPFRGFGNLVIVDHGRQCYSLYGYLDSMSVTKGQTIDRGDPIATSGTTPSGDPALYFELRIDGRPVDPVQWLRKLRKR